jgi:hypothetical protein
MTQDFPFCVRVETPREAFGRIMSEMRMWLDAHKIQLSECRVETTETGVAVDMRFLNEHHASLFQQEFA